jgi:enoyl-CoA hydratase / 3-hydroxyacyl-CoA dehydrogenase
LEDIVNSKNALYRSFKNPLLFQPERPLPSQAAVIGAGTIGPDIGYYLKSALPGINLFLVDVIEEPLKKAENRLNGYAVKSMERGMMKEEQAKKILENITYTTDYERITNCDLVIEAATENIPVKQKIFAKLESVVGPETIITSNTSSIPASRIFSDMNRPGRATVTHFFAPAWRSLAVEVIAWEKVDPKVLDYLMWMFASTGKTPVITDDVICFMVNRVWDNWTNEAAILLDTATAAEIDHVAEEFVPAGPFFVMNMTHGNPLTYETNTLQMGEEGVCYKPPLIWLSVDVWNTKKPGAPMEISDVTRSTVRDRLMGTVFSQSFDIIDRGVGTREDLNFETQTALAFHKGPMDYMRDFGDLEVARIMKRLEADRPGFPTAKKPYAEYQRFNRHLLVDNTDGIKIITMRRPQALNAVNGQMRDELIAALKKFGDDPETKGFILTGYGTTAFSAGIDIGRFPEVLGNRAKAVQYIQERAKLQGVIDNMEKPVVAAVNGIATGGGLELAIRCHSIVATKNASFQFPEITLGISPIGGAIVPYRKWPKGAKQFHEMLCLAKPINAKEAADIGMVDKLTDSYYEMIGEAQREVKRLQGKVTRISDGKVHIPPVEVPEQPMVGKQLLSKEAVSILARIIEQGAATEGFSDALEVDYQGLGEMACTDAAREGINAFLQKRRPEYKK